MLEQIAQEVHSQNEEDKESKAKIVRKMTAAAEKKNNRTLSNRHHESNARYCANVGKQLDKSCQQRLH